MYPPQAAASSCVTVIHTIVAVPMASADAPRPLHGDIAAKPRPDPSTISTIVSAAALVAPANTAAQETALGLAADDNVTAATAGA